MIEPDKAALAKPYTILIEVSSGRWEMDGFDTLKEAIEAEKAGPFVIVRQVQWTVIEAGENAAAPPRAAKERNHTTPEQRGFIIGAVGSILAGWEGPITTARLHTLLDWNTLGCTVSATALGAMLQAAKARFTSHGRKGWTLAKPAAQDATGSNGAAVTRAVQP